MNKVNLPLLAEQLPVAWRCFSLGQETAFVALPHARASGLCCIELKQHHEPLLQRFFVANPEYSKLVYGHSPKPTEAHETLHDTLPEGWRFTQQWVIGYLDENGELAAMASVVSDLLAKGVWHIGLFMVATKRHGSGVARAIYVGLENWAVSGGASWQRLGVVAGNGRAERFWESVGFRESRKRTGVEMGQLVNTVRVMYKPLRDGSLGEYLALVPRDRPDDSNAS